MNIKVETARQFDESSRDFTERMYAEPEEEMQRRACLIYDWGATLRPGDSVLELGCGDGALSCFLARRGLRVTGLDISQGMIEEARQRARREGVTVEFRVGDVDALDVEDSFDAAISFMGAFFMYADDPRGVLERLRAHVRGKVILDWNHRSLCAPDEAARMIADAGFQRVEWRPWFLPVDSRRGAEQSLRRWLEARPLLSLAPLILRRWRYAIYIKGEKPRAGPDASGDVLQGLSGNALPGSVVQRLLLRYGQATRGKRRRI